MSSPCETLIRRSDVEILSSLSQFWLEAPETCGSVTCWALLSIAYHDCDIQRVEKLFRLRISWECPGSQDGFRSLSGQFCRCWCVVMPPLRGPACTGTVGGHLAFLPSSSARLETSSYRARAYKCQEPIVQRRHFRNDSSPLFRNVSRDGTACVFPWLSPSATRAQCVLLLHYINRAFAWTVVDNSHGSTVELSYGFIGPKPSNKIELLR